MGGAKNCPETPRQKMIGMMYLVLTAMLALNVSADILNGFTKLRHSMEATMISTDARNEDVMKSFQSVYEQDGGQEKYGPWLEIAKALKAASDDMYDYIDNFKIDIINLLDGTEYPYGTPSYELKVANNGDTNKPHQYALTQVDEKSGRIHADEFKVRLDSFRYYLTEVESPCFVEKLNADSAFKHKWDLKREMMLQTFSTEDVKDEEGTTISWQRSTFDEMPAGAVLALLTKYQSDIRVAENDLINFVFNAAGSSNFIVNQVTPIVIPLNGEYIMQGQHYVANVYSAMVDTTQKPQVFINGVEVANGHYDVVAGGVGQKSLDGYMLIPGDKNPYPFKMQYTVGVPSATVSNTDLNIMYIGYNNKFSVSVPGVANDKVRVTCGGATVSKDNGIWVIKPTSGSEATIEVSAEVDGKWSTMGKYVYRVKKLPKPTAFFMGSAGAVEDKVSRADLLNAASHLEANYGKDGLINAQFKITGFSVKLPSGKEVQISGNKMDSRTIEQLKGVKQGQMVTFRYIKAVGPDGATINLNPIPLELK